VVFALLLGWLKAAVYCGWRLRPWFRSETLFAILRPGLGLILGLTGFLGSNHAQFRLSPVRIAGKILLYQADLWAMIAAGYVVAAEDWRTSGVMLLSEHSPTSQASACWSPARRTSDCRSQVSSC